MDCLEADVFDVFKHVHIQKSRERCWESWSVLSLLPAQNVRTKDHLMKLKGRDLWGEEVQNERKFHFTLHSFNFLKLLPWKSLIYYCSWILIKLIFWLIVPLVQGLAEIMIIIRKYLALSCKPSLEGLACFCAQCRQSWGWSYFPSSEAVLWGHYWAGWSFLLWKILFILTWNPLYWRDCLILVLAVIF